MLRIAALVLALQAALLTAAPAAQAKAGKTAETNIQQIHNSAVRAPVKSLNDKTYKQFVADRPRDYNVVLMVTATDPKYGCHMCVKAKSGLEEAAKAYHSQYAFNTSEPQERVAFLSAELDEAPQLFRDLRLETVPHVYILPPATQATKKSQLTTYEVDPKPFMDSLSSVLSVIEERTTVKIKVLMDPWPLVVACSLAATMIALFTSVSSYSFLKAAVSYQTPAFWNVVSLICFAVGVSGSIFCVIRTAPLLGYDRAGQLNVFAIQGREQNLLEGIIVAGLTLALSFSYYLLGSSTALRFPVVRHLCVLLCMAIFCTIAVQLWNIYVLKTPWYSFKETVPQELWRALASSVKKTSGLPKRLLRISEVWLYESKDWESFVKKFTVLVVDHVRKQLGALRAAN